MAGRPNPIKMSGEVDSGMSDAHSRASDDTDESGSDASLTQDLNDTLLSKELYGKGRRTLEEHELASPVGTRFMIDRIDRLEGELRQLSKYRERHFDANSKLKILQNRTALDDLTSKLSAGLLAAGSAGAGTVASFLEMSKFSVGLFIVFVLISVSSFFLRVKKNADA